MSTEKNEANPGLYRELSKPFASAEDANTAIDAFFEELKTLRKNHKIADVLCAVAVTVSYPEGEGTATTHVHYGDPLRAEAMAARVLGAEAEQRRIIINRLCAAKR